MSDTEAPLPPYSRDPETTSIRSAAPSYVSDAPSYHSQRTATQRGQGRVHDRDFHGNSNMSTQPHLGGITNISSWSSIHGHQSRAYLSVANRRAARPQFSHTPAPQLLPGGATLTSSDAPTLSADARRERDEKALQEENKSWEFMLSQMADWDEREREWRRFKVEVEGRKGALGARLKRIGFGKGTRK